MRFTEDKVVHHHDVVFLGISRSRRDVTARDSYSRDACVRKHNPEERKSTIARRRWYEAAVQQLAVDAVVLDQRACVSIAALGGWTTAIRLVHVRKNRSKTVDCGWTAAAGNEKGHVGNPAADDAEQT